MKEPRYWSNVLNTLDLHGHNLDDEKGKVAAGAPELALLIR